MKKAAILLLLPLLFLVPNARAEVFNDVQSEHYNGDAIQYLKDSAIVQGYPDGSYKPENRINRAEFTKIIIGATYPDDEISACTKASFPDVPAGEWFSKYVCMAKKHGVVGGYPDGTFKPAGFINFAEASKIVAESQNVPKDTVGTNNEWFAGYVKGLENKKAIPATVQFFDKEITRGEMSETVYRLKDNRTDKVSATYAELTDPLPAIASCPALMDKFKEYQSRQYYPLMRGDVLMMEEADFAGAEAPGPGSETSAAQKSAVADEYSTTNIQVEGVDEADIIKNDGSHIYLVKGDTVRIVRAYPPALMHEESSIDFGDDSFYPQEIYVDSDRLVVIGQSSNYYDIMPMSESAKIMPPYYNTSQTKIYVYDISDKANPKELRHVAFDGYYNTSRRIDNQLYLVLNASPNYWVWDNIKSGDNLVPTLVDGDGEPEAMVGCADIRYFPGYSMPQYLITASFDIDDADSKIHRNVFLGSSDNVYASQTDLFVASRAVDYDRYTDWDWNRDHSKTHIFRFALEDGEMDFKARGEVPGTILNQFSMDQYSGYFRIATNSGNMWNEEDPAINNVYVLDGNMKTVGSLTGLAKGERIYSTRFLGNRLYMVTFKQIDPLFVIGLSNPAKPVVLGELKIPGFSEYIHPYDENNIIGFGQETTENQWGGTVTDGFKMAIFDVSDPNNPKQKFVEYIGDSGTYSELLNNHKALLFDKEKELLAFPITIQEKVSSAELQCGKYLYGTCPVMCEQRCIPSECHLENGMSVCTDDCEGLGSCTDPSYDRYETTFSGALVYTFNLKDGFKERGRVTHFSDDDLTVGLYDYFPYDYNKNIQRIIYIGDFLYSIAQGGVKASTLDTVDKAKYIELAD
ncbi:beta-propeller domain-containing protein [Patescibacteria group bacterium]|nr:beta-propeller domain-containing protein [Patescibacteria group bacterium]MBU1015983.1 beta-propeller domain-containing protein [Patescibacteria group bacterium]MBU1684808.1 beta-propeller domain-containing protein [Patescibacteria group bacterium]